MYFFSKTQNAFFNDAVHGPRTMMVPDPALDAPPEGEEDTRPLVEVQNGRIPGDAVEITDDRHAELIEGIGKGHVLGAAEDGTPILLDVPTYYANFTPEQMKADFNSQRGRRIQETQWLVDRHRDETEMKKPTTLSPARYSDLLEYRQAVRDMKMEYPLQFPVNPEP